MLLTSHPQSLQGKFLNSIAQKFLYRHPNPNNVTKMYQKYGIVKLRFDPCCCQLPGDGEVESINKSLLARAVYNYCQEYKNSTQNWDKKDDFYSDYRDKIFSETLGKVIKKLTEELNAEMHPNHQCQLPQPQGRGNPGSNNKAWEVFYEWLWEQYFPRFIVNQGIWEFIQDIAFKLNDQQIKFEAIETREKAIDKDEIPDWLPSEEHQQLQVGVRYRVKLNLDPNFFNLQEGHLLLIKRSSDGQDSLLSPSLTYCSPKTNADYGADKDYTKVESDKEIYIPSLEWYEARAYSIKFKDPSQETFLAIVTPKELNLSWVNMTGNPEEDVPKLKDIELNEGRMQEIFEKVGIQGNSLVLTRTFEVTAQ